MQLTVNNRFDIGVLGQRTRMGFPSYVESGTSIDPNPLHFGTGLAKGNTPGQVRAPRLNRTTLTLSTDLITGNSTVVTVNGVSTTATVYASSHAATMTAIVNKILALAPVKTASATGDVITIDTIDSDAVATAVITLGNSQPTVVVATTTFDAVAGIVGFEQKESTLEAIGSATAAGGVGASAGQGYLTGEIAKVVRKDIRLVPVVVGTAIADGTTAYIIVAATNRGLLTDASSGNLKVGVFRSATSTLADTTVCAEVEVDLSLLPA